MALHDIESMKAHIAQLQQTIDLLKAKSNKSKKILVVPRVVDNGSTIPFEVPTYRQIFRPPQEKEPGKLYGKKYLLTHCKDDQNIVYCANHQTVKDWVINNGIFVDLRHNEEDQKKIKKFIKENYKDLLPLKFGEDVRYRWKRKDVYRYYVQVMQSTRKSLRKKNNGLTCPSKNHAQGDLLSKEGKENHVINEHQGAQITIDDKENHASESIMQDVYCPELPPQIDNDDDFNIQEDDDPYAQFCTFEAQHGPKYPKDINDICYGMTSSEATITCKESTLEENLQESVANTFIDEALCERKSKRVRKLSKKLEGNAENKRAHSSKKKAKKMKDLNKLEENLEEYNSLVSLKETYNGPFSHEDEETILMKFFGFQNVKELIISLKSNFNLIKRERSFCGDRNARTSEEMCHAIVEWLVFTKRVLIHKMDDRQLCFDDVDVAHID